MEKKKFSVSPMLIVVILLAAVLAGVIFLTTNYHLVDFKLYPRNAAQLDLRGQEISASHYNTLQQLMPDCEIHWDVRFQGKPVSNDVTEITVSGQTVSQDDLLALTYLPQLKTVHAEECGDYAAMAAVQQAMPQLQVLYNVDIGGTKVSSADESVLLGDVPQEELAKLDYLPNVKSVAASDDCTDPALLQTYCQQRQLGFGLLFRGELLDPELQELTVENITEEELPGLLNLGKLKKLHLVSPQAKPESVFALKEQLSNTEVTWEVYIAGEMYHSFWAEEELNLSELQIESIQEVENALAYLPQVTKIFLGEQEALSNEDLAAYRDQVREKYKVVWAIRLGESDPIRTDITYFMPGRDGKAMNLHFKDDVSYNLRYCEDIISLDVGHLGVSDTSFLEGLTNLEYLILAHTGVTKLDGIENCTKLKFLEIHWTGVKDLAPLKGLTALEDINFGETWPDVSALKEMPWLKHIYMIGGDRGDAWELSQALPDTRVVVTGTATVASGWRRLPNYYAMRDALHAPYMN